MLICVARLLLSSVSSRPRRKASRQYLTWKTEFQIPPQVSRYASFLFSFIGRGVCTSCPLHPPSSTPSTDLTPSSLVYIFTGSILLDVHTLDKVFGSIIGIIGLAYVVLEFIPSIEPPQNMRYDPFFPPLPISSQANPHNREADAGWGAEQV